MSKPPKAPRDKGWDILSQMTQPNQSELKCGHTAPDWNGEGDCITCARDRVLGASDIDRKIDELKKAFGGCTSCYGKGYATWRHGEFYKGRNHNLRNNIKFYNCPGGKALLALINEARLDGAIMGAKFGNAAFRQNSIAKPGEPINLDAVLQSGIEQATKWAKPDTTLEGGK